MWVAGEEWLIAGMLWKYSRSFSSEVVQVGKHLSSPCVCGEDSPSLEAFRAEWLSQRCTRAEAVSAVLCLLPCS